MAKNAYSTSLTRQQLDSSTLQVTEDILFNNVRVGGVRVTFTFLQPDAQKLAGFTIVSNVGDATHLDQQVDLTYGGAVFMRLSISALPQPGDPDVPHSIDIETTAVNPESQPPISLQTDRLA